MDEWKTAAQGPKAEAEAREARRAARTRRARKERRLAQRRASAIRAEENLAAFMDTRGPAAMDLLGSCGKSITIGRYYDGYCSGRVFLGKEGLQKLSLRRVWDWPNTEPVSPAEAVKVWTDYCWSGNPERLVPRLTKKLDRLGKRNASS